jgi:hypothetical protein
MAQYKDASVAIHSFILRSASLVVPRESRAEWLAEWNSELWYVLQKSDRAPNRLWSDREALSFCLGAFKDAMWLRRHACSSCPRKRRWLQSSSHCLVFLAAVAASAISGFFRSSGPYDTIMRTAQDRAGVLAQVWLIAIALLVLPVTTTLALGEYPANQRSPVRAKRFRRWLFLGIKFALALSIVFCGSLDLASITGLQPHATLVAYLLAFRWVLVDQRNRCPVCLRLLTNPATIGQPSQTLTGWYGTEYFCARGHGLMYVPEITTSYSTQRWQDLDPSWGNLFSE